MAPKKEQMIDGMFKKCVTLVEGEVYNEKNANANSIRLSHLNKELSSKRRES